MTTQQATQPSTWQERITGEWYGAPSVFDTQGNHVGYNKVSRASVFEDGKTTYWMNTRLDAVGPLRARFEFTDFEFDVIDSDRDRIYLGPDFIGAGHPYGALVDAHYYSPAWRADLRTMVHVLEDNETQVYSSLLYDGPTIFSVFNGVYKKAFDYDSNPETQATIDTFIETERRDGPSPHMLPPKHKGVWTGSMQVYDAMQEPIGTNQVVIGYEPLTLLRAKQTVSISGEIERSYSFERTRNGNQHTFDGPDIVGNGMGYGRALYTSQHFYKESFKIKGREFIIDDAYTMSVVWQFFGSDQMRYTTFGLLIWEATDETISKVLD